MFFSFLSPSVFISDPISHYHISLITGVGGAGVITQSVSQGSPAESVPHNSHIAGIILVDNQGLGVCVWVGVGVKIKKKKSS